MGRIVVAFSAIVAVLSGCSHAPSTRTSLPGWIVSQSSSSLIVCSSDGIDPQQLQELSEAKCLASAARSKGVDLSLRQKTLQSLSGSDSGEVAEVSPINGQVRCDFKYRYLEDLSSGGFRLWLGCMPGSVHVQQQAATERERGIAADAAKIPYKRGTFQLTCSPMPDKIIVGGSRGERVVEGGSMQTTVELREGDEWIEVRKQRYQSKRLQVGDWEHGASLSEAILLDPEI